MPLCPNDRKFNYLARFSAALAIAFAILIGLAIIYPSPYKHYLRILHLF